MTKTKPVETTAPKSQLPEKVLVPHPDPTIQNTKELGVLDGAAMGVGTAGGAAMGIAAGTALGPIGMVAGAVVGGVAGGLMGKETAKLLDPDADELWIRAEYSKGTHANPDMTFEDYAFAYRFGAKAEESHRTQSFQELESKLCKEYELTTLHKRWSWELAKPMIADGFNQVREYRKSEAKMVQA